jgi:serine/threonine protein kinase
MDSAQGTVFVSYSHVDEAWKDRVAQHVGVLQFEGALELWDDRRIAPGEDWHASIQRTLESARVALLLVSASSLTSPFILDAEIPILLRRRIIDGLRLIPVIVRPCAWQEVTWLASIQVVPKDGRALSTLSESEADDALASLARDVRRSLTDELQPARAEPLPPTIPPIGKPPPVVVPADRLDGDPLAGYDVVKEIQIGNVGRVLKCRIHATGETCVVKETDVEHASRRALAALAELRCPNIAAARRVWETERAVYEELPYVGGVPVQALVAPGMGGLSGSLLQSFHRQVELTLGRLHAAGIIHRDIHPANIYAVFKRPAEMARMGENEVERTWLFDAFGGGQEAFLLAWVIVDCTFAAFVNDAAQSAYRHGAFTPEEQELGAATTASDMYAFGATLYYGITGTEPPSAQNRRLDPRAQLELPPWVRESNRFLHHVDRLLSLRPEERPAADPTRDEGSIASFYSGTVEFPGEGVILVDSFPRATRLVDRPTALEFHRRLRKDTRDEDLRPLLEHWIERLSQPAA